LKKRTLYILVLYKLIPGRFIAPGKDLAGMRDILFHAGTIPDNPRQLVIGQLTGKAIKRLGVDVLERVSDE